MAKTLRVLPPAAGALAPVHAFSAFSKITTLVSSQAIPVDDASKQTGISDHFGPFFPRHHTLLLNSGKSSLALLFRYLKQTGRGRRVCLGAYNCPEIISAAQYSGLDVRLLPIDDRSLRLTDSAIERLDVGDILVLTNLYGIYDLFDGKLPPSTVVVDDASQAALGFEQGDRVGSRSNFGVLSFGRGKALAGAGGGALLVHSSEWELMSQEGSGYHLIRGGLVSDLAKTTLLWMLEHPLFYRFPVSLPQLGLGAVHFERALEPQSATEYMAAVALAKLELSSYWAKVMRANSLRWSEGLASLGFETPFDLRGGRENEGCVPIRFPLLLDSGEQRDRVWQKLARGGKGASLSYMKALYEMPGLGEILGDAVVRDRELSKAGQVASRLLTLPVHPYVRRSDIEESLDIIRKAL